MTSAIGKRIGLHERAVPDRWFACLLLWIVMAASAAVHAAEPLRPDRESLDRSTPELIERLRADPYDYFRFINRSWITRVCERFSKDLEGLPIVRLHGDAHIEQFAVAADDPSRNMTRRGDPQA